MHTRINSTVALDSAMAKFAAAGLAVAGFIAAGCTMPHPAAAAGERTESPAKLSLEIVARHLSVDAGELKVVRVEPMQWRDSAIGCPEPGMGYTQVVTYGYFALVRDASGMTHRVHMADGMGFVCDHDPKAGHHPKPIPTFSQHQLETLARADLAQRLGVSTEAVSLVGTRPVEWLDASLGCAANEEIMAGGPSKGFVITMAHAGRYYTYHTDLRQATPCPPIESQ